MKFSKYNLIIPSKKKEHFYLFNTFNGSCFEIDSSIAYIIKAGSTDTLQEETRELLALSGVAIADEVNEDYVLAYNHGRSKYSNFSHMSTVLLTRDCNLKCAYCFQGTEKASETMTMEQADRYINFTLTSAKQSGAKDITIYLFGGEPLMNMDVGFYILDKIKSHCDENDMNFSSHIITNGTLLNSELIEKLLALNCKSMQITLDGIKEVHNKRRMYVNGNGSFDETLNALRLLNEIKDISTAIRINIDKTNVSDTYALLDFIGKDGENLTNCSISFGIVRTQGAACSGYSSNCLSDIETGDVQYELWSYAEKQGFKHKRKPQRRFIYCGMYCDNAYTITPSLDVYKCLEHVGVSEHLMGRIDEQGHLVDQTPAFYEWMTVDPFKNEECMKCVYLPTCGGGCGVTAYTKTGSYQAKGCYLVKGTVEKQVLKFVEDTMKSRV